MNTTRNILSLAIIIVSINIHSQQEPLYSQYYNSFNILNPAYAGAHNFFTITTSARRQWVQEPGGPKSATLSIHGNVGKNVGIGFSTVYDKISVLNETGIYADFSYTVTTSENSKLAFGIKGGGSYINVNLTELGLNGDPLFSQNINTFTPNIGAGIFYYTDRFYASYSALNLLNESYYDKKSGIVASASDNILMYLSSGYNFKLNDNLDLKPSFLVRYSKGSPFSTDLSLAILWMNKLELGVSYRMDDSVVSLLQLRFNDTLKIGYTYDSYISNLGRHNSGSHELNLVFDIGKSAKKKGSQSAPFYW